VFLLLINRQGDRCIKNKPIITTKVNIIRQPKDYLLSGIACFLLSIGLTFFVLCSERIESDKPEAIISIVFIFLLSIASMFVIVVYINWKIEIGISEFIFTNAFRRKRIYSYEDIEMRQLKACTRFYYNGKHIVAISVLQKNFNALENAIFDYRLTEMNKRGEELHNKDKVSKKKK
jgi:formate/nitrite transporter FocA (FNT family)